MNKKKVLITGASGFVGYHLIVAALREGLDVYAAVRPNSNVRHLEELDIKYVNLNFSAIDKLVADLEDKKYHYIIHAAGITKAKTLEEYEHVNAGLTKNLAIAASSVSYPLEKFVFVSSLAAIGPINELSDTITDNTIPHPVTRYGMSKKLAEEYLNEIDNLPLLTFRPTAVYGPREKDIFILFKTINGGLEPYIGKIAQQLSFIYVKDLTDIMISALKSNVVHKTYNVSDGSTYDRYALANALKRTLKKKTLKLHIPLGIIKVLASFLDKIYANSSTTPTLNKEKINELTAANWACDIANLKADLKFEPKYNLDQGVAESVEWYKKNNWLK